MINKLIFRESLGFEDMEIQIVLDKQYDVVEEFDGVVYIKDEIDSKIGFEITALDDTVEIIENDGEL